MVQVDFLFDFGSPNAYLAHRIIPRIEKRTGARFNYVPILLGGIFKATGNQSPATAHAGILNKQDYENREMRRFVERHGIDGFGMNPHFPVNTLALMRGAIAASLLGIADRYVDEMFRYMWRDHRKMDDPSIILAALRDAGLPADEILSVAQQPEVKKQLADNTAIAVERGAFGSPTFFVEDEMYFGKDRLREVEEAIEFANAVYRYDRSGI